MKNGIKQIIAFIFFLFFISLSAQTNIIKPDLSKCNDPQLWELHNRELTLNEEVHLSGSPGDGFLMMKDLKFSNGTIDLDIKGKDIKGKSFVGIAFHGLNDSTYDVIYFRPFNFQSSEKQKNSVQYISLPEYEWSKLRKEHPGVYENSISPIPDPDDWFHVSLVINYPEISVYINNSQKPSLTVKQLSSQKEGWLGFWTGHNSEGYFKNLTIHNKTNWKK